MKWCQADPSRNYGETEENQPNAKWRQQLEFYAEEYYNLYEENTSVIVRHSVSLCNSANEPTRMERLKA